MHAVHMYMRYVYDNVRPVARLNFGGVLLDLSGIL